MNALNRVEFPIRPEWIYIAIILACAVAWFLHIFGAI